MSDEPDRVAMVSDLTAVRTELGRHFDDKLEKRLSETEERIRRHVDVVLEKRLSETVETMRRHFEIVAERVESSVKLVAEVSAHHASILSNHEARLQKIEKRR